MNDFLLMPVDKLIIIYLKILSKQCNNLKIYLNLNIVTDFKSAIVLLLLLNIKSIILFVENKMKYLNFWTYIFVSYLIIILS